MKNKIVAMLLAFFVGSFGVHRFYLGQTKKGLLYLLFFWTVIPGFIAFYDFLVFAFMSDEKFNALYNDN